MTASPLAQTPNDMFNAPIAEADPEIAEILDAELSRQQNGLEMIASENFVPRAVLQAQGSVLTNKYAEGYPGRRYYGGCEQVDKIETIARERAKSLFGAEYANVQPHSGAQANAAVYQALVKPGDTVLGLALDHGGHLTHGMKINFSGRFYHAEAYGVNPETFRIDPEIIRQRALETHPAMIIGGWSAYPRIEDFKAMKEIADEVGAKFWVDMAHFAGLIAAGLHPSPVPYADALGFGVDEDGDGFVGVAGAVDVDVHVAGSGFDDGDFGVAYHGLDESCSPAWDEHVDVAACFHHGGGAVASVLVYGGDHVVVVSVFGEYVGDDGECCRVGVFGRVSAAQQDGVAGFDA